MLAETAGATGPGLAVVAPNLLSRTVTSPANLLPRRQSSPRTTPWAVVTGEPGLSLGHLGVSAPDIWAAIDWYTSTLGFPHLMGPRVMESTGAGTAETGSILGRRFRRAYQAQVVSGNGVGLELFQFLDPAATPSGARRPLSHPYIQVFAGWLPPGTTHHPTWFDRDGTTYTGPMDQPRPPLRHSKPAEHLRRAAVDG